MIDNQASTARTSHSVAWSTFYGGLSALGYTSANIFLRAASDLDPIWVSCVKAIPTVVVTAPWLLAIALQGKRVFPATKVMLLLALAAVFGHVGGNVVFQWCLGVIGLAMTVPLCMGGILIFSVLLGRVYLREQINALTLFSTAVLIAAVWVLSMGAGRASDEIASQNVGRWLVTAAVFAACLSGLAYAVLGVVIRYAVQTEASVAATTFSVSVVGLVCLASLSCASVGPGIVVTTAGFDWLVMLSAGVGNVVAFLALTRALQLATLTYVNALNASQVAMCALCGVFLFNEPLSAALGVGVALTAAGLILMPRRGGSAPAGSDPVGQLDSHDSDSDVVPSSSGVRQEA